MGAHGIALHVPATVLFERTRCGHASVKLCSANPAPLLCLRDSFPGSTAPGAQLAGIVKLCPVIGIGAATRNSLC